MTELVRSFSALGPYQAAHTLTYTGRAGADGFVLSVRRDAVAAPGCCETVRLSVPPPQGELLLRFLYENCVPLQNWRDVLAELLEPDVKIIKQDGM